MNALDFRSIVRITYADDSYREVICEGLNTARGALEDAILESSTVFSNIRDISFFAGTEGHFDNNWEIKLDV